MGAVAVVVPTVDRPELLLRCLHALGAQERPADEVVVVHDGAPGVEELLRPWHDRLPLTVLRGPSGAAGKRNLGWRATVAELVAFTDDDCAPRPGWLAALTAASGGLLHGPVLPHPADAHVDAVFGRTLDVRLPGDHFPTANLAVRRQWLERVGGFDPSLSAGEDTDLAWRVRAAGAGVAWAEAAQVLHAVRPLSFPEHLRSLWRWRALPEVVRRHPQLREGLLLRVFWKPSHPLALLALGALATPWRRPAALLAAPLLVSRVRERGLRWGTQVAVADVAEVAVVLAGSARARTVLL